MQAVFPVVVVKEPIVVPAHAYKQLRNRYRADSLIAYLKNNSEKGYITIGLTVKDINSTKGSIEDWGIMGLAYTPGAACAVSSFRLKKHNTENQFYKLCIHELGHTAGLNHCATKTCFMRDAEGGNPLDEESSFCASCRFFLVKKGWALKQE